MNVHALPIAKAARTVVSALLFGLVAAQPLTSAIAQPAGGVARIETLTGEALVVREDGSIDASPGLHLEAGDSLETADGARVELLFADGTTLVVGPEAEIKIEDYLLADDGSRRNGAVTLVDGVVRAVVSPGPADSFTIQGQAAVASVRGTELLVIEEEETTSVFVVEGHVIMQGPVGIWLVKLAPGEGADARLEPASPLPPEAPAPMPEETDGGADVAPSGDTTTGAGGTDGDETDDGASSTPPSAAAAPLPAPVASRDAGSVAQPRAITSVVSGPRPEVAAWPADRVGALIALTTLP